VGKASFAKGMPGHSEDDTKMSPDYSQGIGNREVDLLRSKGYIGVYVTAMEERDNLSLHENERCVVGVLGIVDSLEENARPTILALKRLGIDVWMCTGDHETTARAVAQQVGVDESNVCAGVTPKGKADLIKRLQRKKRLPSRSLSCCVKRGGNGKVAMIGDGINDSAALAWADVGIAIGAGTEVAVEAADIVLVRSNLTDVVVALHLSRSVFNRIQMNFVWAMAYNLFAIPFAAGAFYPWTSWRVPPAFAGFMMALSSVSVVTSSLLLRCYSKPRIDEGGQVREQDIFYFLQRAIILVVGQIFSICSLQKKKKKSTPQGNYEGMVV